MTEKKEYIATVGQVDAALEALKNIEDKPQVLSREEVLKKMSDAIMRLYNGRHTVKEIVELINKAQGEDKFFSIRATEVKRIISEMSPIMEARKQSRKEYARKRRLAASLASSVKEVQQATEDAQKIDMPESTAENNFSTLENNSDSRQEETFFQRTYP